MIIGLKDMIIKGINTAPIKQGDHLCLMTFKVIDTNGNHCVFYMPVNTLIDFMIILRSRLLEVSQKIIKQGELYQQKLKSDIELLVANVPEIMSVEFMQPKAEYIVTSLTPKFKDEQFSLIIMLQNEQVIVLDISETQVEFIIAAIQQAIKTINDNETLQIIFSLLDFLLFYTVDLTNLEYLNFKEINHEPWKQHLFSNYCAVLYCFETEKGKEILAGAVIKANSQPESQETENIIQRVAHLSPMLKALKDKYPLCQTFSQRIPSQPMQILSKEECLNPLHAFCLKILAEMKP